MKKHIRHTAILLLIFIAYPFVFQTLHIMFHDHGHDHVQKPGLSHGQIITCTPHMKNCGHSAQIPHNHDGTALPFQHALDNPECSGVDYGHCPLCEHEFAKFSISSLYAISFSDERVSAINTCFYQNPPVLYQGTHISLRAPPITS
jgi:hypothetical protein